jgi:DNA uptake protein ComE-like DNA-binding protein
MEDLNMKRIILPVVAAVLAFGITSAVRADEPAAATTQATPPAATAPAKSTSMHSTTTTHHHSSTSHKVDLNSASKEQLMKLQGIDDATADKIIAARPFKSASELTSKSIISKEEYKKVSAHVTVKKAS